MCLQSFYFCFASYLICSLFWYQQENMCVLKRFYLSVYLSLCLSVLVLWYTLRCPLRASCVEGWSFAKVIGLEEVFTWLTIKRQGLIWREKSGGLWSGGLYVPLWLLLWFFNCLVLWLKQLSSTVLFCNASQLLPETFTNCEPK